MVSSPDAATLGCLAPNLSMPKLPPANRGRRSHLPLFSPTSLCPIFLSWAPCCNGHLLPPSLHLPITASPSPTLLLWLNNAVPYQGTECEYRHSQAILLRLQRGQAVATCPAWSGEGCSNVACPWRHPINNTGVSASVRETIDEPTTACRCLSSRCSPVSRLHACVVLASQFLLLIYASIVFACPATPMSVPRFACPGHTVRVFVCVSPCVCSPVGTSLWASAPRVLPAPSPMTDLV